MSGFLLDTNVPSEVIRSKPRPSVVSWLQKQDDTQLFLSVITVAELRRGIALLPDGERRRRLSTWLDSDLLPLFSGRILPVTEAIACRWAEVSAQRQRAGRLLSMADGLIAATAFEHSLTVITRNVADYAGLGVDIIDPWN